MGFVFERQRKRNLLNCTRGKNFADAISAFFILLLFYFANGELTSRRQCLWADSLASGK